MSSNSKNEKPVNAAAQDHTIIFNIDMSTFKNSTLGTTSLASEDSCILPNVIVKISIPSSNENIGSICGKPLDNTHRTSQSDRHVCLSDGVIFDGEPSGDTRQQKT